MAAEFHPVYLTAIDGRIQLSMEGRPMQRSIRHMQQHLPSLLTHITSCRNSQLHIHTLDGRSILLISSHLIPFVGPLQQLIFHYPFCSFINKQTRRRRQQCSSLHHPSASASSSMILLLLLPLLALSAFRIRITVTELGLELGCLLLVLSQ